MAIFLLISALLPGCSHRKKISKQEVQSELRSVTSLVAETQTFLGYLRQGRATRNFAQAHATYLENEAKRSAHELGEADPEIGTENALHRCQAQLETLRRELTSIHSAIGDDQKLTAIEAQLQAMRADLEQAQSSL
jgi:hypothetical protein